MNSKGRPTDDEIVWALTVMQDADVSESDADAALKIITRQLPDLAPPAHFSRHVLAAVHQSPLPSGRRKLRARNVAARRLGIAGAAAAAVFGTVLILSLPDVLVRAVAVAVQACLLVSRSVVFALDIWTSIGRTAAPLIRVTTLTPMVTALIGITLLSVVSLLGLTRLVSHYRES